MKGVGWKEGYGNEWEKGEAGAKEKDEGEEGDVSIL